MIESVDAIRAMRDGRAKVFMGMGGNFVSAAPDTAVTENALPAVVLPGAVSVKLEAAAAVGFDGVAARVCTDPSIV